MSTYDVTDTDVTGPGLEGDQTSEVKQEPHTNQASLEGCSTSTLETQLCLAQSFIARQEQEINSLKCNKVVSE